MGAAKRWMGLGCCRGGRERLGWGVSGGCEGKKMASGRGRLLALEVERDKEMEERPVLVFWVRRGGEWLEMGAAAPLVWEKKLEM
jgi:hypothetical protein